jgi:hypothetical protein
MLTDRTIAVDFLVVTPSPLLIPEPGRYEFRIKCNQVFLGNIVIDAVANPQHREENYGDSQ